VTRAPRRHPVTFARLAALGAFAALAAALLAGCGASTIPPVHSEGERLELGRRALTNREYNVAIELLKSYVEASAGSADVDQAIEMLGESYLHIHEWAEAQSQFERLVRDFPESDSAAAGSYHLGEALWGQSRGPAFDQEYTLKALEQWETYLRSYPDHWLHASGEKWAQRCRERLADKLALSGELYLKLRRVAPARVYFHRVLDELPNTAVAARAELGLMLADGLAGQRAEAIAQLTDFEARHRGDDLGTRAAREIERLKREEKRGKKK
jgi:outer membrane protein assembly factor BamD (BamD/ComL family)